MAEDETKQPDVPAAAPAEDADDTPPRVWLKYNPKSGRYYGHIPQRGSGPDGELSPEEVRGYFRTRAAFKAATEAPDGQEPLYVRVRAPKEDRADGKS